MLSMNLSDNYHIKRFRQRLKTFTEDKKLVERVKKIDQAAIAYAIKKAKEENPTVNSTTLDKIRSNIIN